jgi:hypothetical protein
VIKSKIPFYGDDDDKFLGFVVRDGTGWRALTIFGYLIAHTATSEAAEAVLREVGATYLKGIWQYYDTDDNDWFYCVIKKAYEQSVVVNRTNALGYQDPEDYKQVEIEMPTETNLIKSS